jgi:hypothetical protein
MAGNRTLKLSILADVDNLKKNQKTIGKTWVGKTELFNPEANILIRIQTDDSKSRCKFN